MRMTVQRAQRPCSRPEIQVSGRLNGAEDRPDRMDPGRSALPLHTFRAPTLIYATKVGHTPTGCLGIQGLVFKREVLSRAEGSNCPPLEPPRRAQPGPQDFERPPQQEGSGALETMLSPRDASNSAKTAASRMCGVATRATPLAFGQFACSPGMWLDHIPTRSKPKARA